MAVNQQERLVICLLDNEQKTVLLLESDLSSEADLQRKETMFIGNDVKS